MLYCCYFGKSIWLNGNHFLYYSGYKSWRKSDEKRIIENNKLSILLKHLSWNNTWFRIRNENERKYARLIATNWMWSFFRVNERERENEIVGKTAKCGGQELNWWFSVWDGGFFKETFFKLKFQCTLQKELLLTFFSLPRSKVSSLVLCAMCMWKTEWSFPLGFDSIVCMCICPTVCQARQQSKPSTGQTNRKQYTLFLRPAVDENCNQRERMKNTHTHSMCMLDGRNCPKLK